MTALPPRHALDTVGRRSSTRHAVRKVTTIPHRGPKNGIPSTSFTHIGATAPSSQNSRQPREPQVNHQGRRDYDPESQLRSDFELAFNLAAEEFLDHSTTNGATTPGAAADAPRGSTLNPERIHNSFWANNHEEQLEDRAYIAHRKQDDWYNGILDRSRAQEAARRERFQQNRDEWEDITRAESEAYHRAQEEALANRRARLAAEAEERRSALEQEQRIREQAIAARQAEIAAEEERRRRQEEERRARLRECAVSYQKTSIAGIRTSSWNMQRPIQYIVPTALAVYSSPLHKPKDQISSSVRVARRSLVGIAEIGLTQGQTVRQTLRHNKQGLWLQHKAGKLVLRVLISSLVQLVASTCAAAVGLNSAMAADNSIRSVKAVVGHTSFNTGCEEGSREERSTPHLWQLSLAYEHQLRSRVPTPIVLRNGNKHSKMSNM